MLGGLDLMRNDADSWHDELGKRFGAVIGRRHHSSEES